MDGLARRRASASSLPKDEETLTVNVAGPREKGVVLSISSLPLYDCSREATKKELFGGGLGTFPPLG